MVADARWLVSAVLLVISLYLSAGNLWIAVRWVVAKKRESMVALVGGVSGMLGLLLIPMIGPGRFWWLPLVLDLGSVPLLVSTIAWFVVGQRRGAPPA